MQSSWYAFSCLSLSASGELFRFSLFILYFAMYKVHEKYSLYLYVVGCSCIHSYVLVVCFILVSGGKPKSGPTKWVW